MKLPPAEAAALDELAHWARGRFGARLEALVLFGSRARGEAHEESDVDVLVAVAGVDTAERREITDLAGDLLTRHGVVVSVFAPSAERWSELRARERRIAREIERDGISL